MVGSISFSFMFFLGSDLAKASNVRGSEKHSFFVLAPTNTTNLSQTQDGFHRLGWLRIEITFMLLVTESTVQHQTDVCRIVPNIETVFLISQCSNTNHSTIRSIHLQRAVDPLVLLGKPGVLYEFPSHLITVT